MKSVHIYLHYSFITHLIRQLSRCIVLFLYFFILSVIYDYKFAFHRADSEKRMDAPDGMSEYGVGILPAQWTQLITYFYSTYNMQHNI